MKSYYYHDNCRALDELLCFRCAILIGDHARNSSMFLLELFYLLSFAPSYVPFLMISYKEVSYTFPSPIGHAQSNKFVPKIRLNPLQSHPHINSGQQISFRSRIQ